MEQELTQEGAAKEQVTEKLEPSSEVASTETKETSEKTRTEKEFTTMQSMKDKADARAIKAETLVGSVQNDLQEFRNEMERQKKVTQQKEIDSLAEDPDAQSRLRRLYQRENDMGKAETELQKKADGLTKKWNDAIDLATRYNVDVNELLVTDSPVLMEKMAKLMAQVKVAEGEKIQAKVPTGASDFKPDSGTSDAGGDDDDTFMKKYSEGKSDDHARADKILKKA